jgi:threonine synthase
MREAIELRQTFFRELHCSRCGKWHDPSVVQTVCSSCDGTLFSSYDLEKAKDAELRGRLSSREKSLWRYRELLPVFDDANVVSLGEGCTPIDRLPRIGGELGVKSLQLKDDGIIPTGTFKARGQTVAISRAKELGISKVVLASAGNAAGAMATYAARAGMEAHVFLPKDAPETTKKECLQMKAEVHLVEGLINDAGKIVASIKEKKGWFDLSTLKEPYRVEGKKTMGYEIAEQSGWSLPDVLLYPTGGGTGLIGMWKAFKEMEAMGWIGSERPRMVAVQSEGCAPVVKAHEEGSDRVAGPFANAETVAAGIRVPFPYASEQILRVVDESHGTAVAVTDGAILRSMKDLGREGIMACPEGAATLAALRKLLDAGWIDPDEGILLYNTGTGLKYPELFELPEIDGAARIR